MVGLSPSGRTSPQTEVGQQRADEAAVTVVNMQDGVVGVTARLFLPCPPAILWVVLTDYDHLHEFIPKMLHSELVHANGSTKTVKQTGRTGISVFQVTARVLLAVREDSLHSILFHSMKGDFKVFRGSWRLQEDTEQGGTWLTYHAEIKPRFPTPQALIRHVQKKDLPDVMRAILLRAAVLKNRSK